MKACIFDLDGTLTDTLDSLTLSVNETMKQLGVEEITREQCRAYVGNGAKNLIRTSLMRTNKEHEKKLEEAMVIYGRVFGENCMYHVEPYEGILALLEKLKKAGVSLAVLSNKPHRQTVDVVRDVFGNDLFDFVQGQQDDKKRKPHRESIEHVMKQLCVEAQDCVYVGDSEVDIATGIAANVKTIGVSWGFRDYQDLKEAGATYIVNTPIELYDLMGGA